MKTRFILAITSIVLLLSGCFLPQPDDIKKVEGIQPVWTTQLATTCLTYNKGLIGLPLYNDKVLFNSTNFSRLNSVDKNIYEEDNRINALDINTGEVHWTFPAEYSKENPMYFDSKPYCNNNYLVVKMSDWGTKYEGGDILLCFDMTTGTEKWKRVIPKNMSYNTNNNLLGLGKTFYFTQETETEALICKGDIETGNWEILSTIKAENSEDIASLTTSVPVMSSIDGKDFLIVGGYEEKSIISDEETQHKCYLYFANRNNGNINKVFVEHYDSNMIVGNLNLYGDKLYFTSGRHAFCYDLEQNQIQWHFFSNEAYDYMAPLLIVSHDVVFLYGNNRYIGLDAQTGHKLYQGNTECAKADVFDGRVYLIGRMEQLHVLDIKTGRELHRITCPEDPKTGNGFHIGCKPQVHGDKLFVFSYTSAYCYDLADLK
ncbi:MAG TPA: PQQ-binding-like beta-propeller repeat protein [Paludibacter sp.]|nr:PQQ-binding-like beta-propeller repeat protein [Paludibacter sp.]HOS45769.1 PQQ-binding-like beta-propeller repeat protein [Paludibacter sp.]HPM09198.1 PQQ-binding-like beta-propeller repeat protein [Paludibacter sp.]